MIIIEPFLSAVVQIALFTMIPLVFYLLRHRKTTGFSRYIGLKAPPARAVAFALSIAVLYFVVTTLIYLQSGLREILTSPETVSGSIRELGLGAAAVAVLLIHALKTGLSEEILFRGFIGKRMMARFGFVTGNSLQALLFALLHGLMLPPSAGFAAVTVLSTVVIA